MLSNRHLVVALLVAPLLSIAAWWAAGEFTGEQPHAARPGHTYPLLAKSNCRYASGACDLENTDLKLTLTLAETKTENVLRLRSSHALEGIMVSVAKGEAETQPVAMIADSAAGREWYFVLLRPPTGSERIRVVASASGSIYFGDVGLAFTKADTF